MSEPSPLATLALDVLMARGVQPRVVSDMWMTREVPAWLIDPVMIGALARLTPHEGSSEAQLRARARALLRTRGDRGWGGFIEVMLNLSRAPDSSYWLRKLRNEWPPALLRWPEERVKAMTFLMREQPTLGPASAVALFEIVETKDELTLARWLTGRTWVKGVRMVEVMEAAHLTYAGSPRHTSELWHMLCKDKRVWLLREHITEIDKNYARDALAWFTALDRLRRYRT